MKPVSNHSRIAVLVVEDEPLLRMDAADLIEDAGYAVYEACNADEAVAILETNGDIGIVFTDIDMPGSMDGCGLARLVMKRWPSVKIVMTSGQRKSDEIDSSCGGCFVAKPYPPGVMTKAIADVAPNR